MDDMMHTPFGDIDPAEVEAATAAAAAADRAKGEEITIKFAKGLVSEPFISKDGRELVRIQIPNADPNDHDPWQEFVLGTNQVHENQYGKGLWAKIPAEGHTKVSRPFLAGQDENGRNIWKREMRTVSNRELKEMVEFYKTRGRDERTSSSADRQAQEKTGPDRESASQKAEPESEKASGKAPPGDRSSVKEQLEAGRKEAEKTKSPKAKTGKKQNKEPEL